MEILNEVGATVNKSKCLFFGNEIEYIGFLINKNDIRVNPRKIDPIINMPQPTNVKQLQSFLGAVNYYSKFIQNMADMAKHLYKLIEKNAIWIWKNECDNSFRVLKQRLSESPVLSMYDPDLRLKVDCDASKYDFGAVLSHKYPGGTEKPIIYASRTLNKNEINYSQVDKEGASIIFVLKKFNQYLLGNNFTLTADNKTIKNVFDPKTEINSIAAGRLARWALLLTQYNYTLEFRKSNKYLNADMLSRLPVTETAKGPSCNVISHIQIETLPVTAAEIKISTKKGPILSEVLKYFRDDKWPEHISQELRPYFTKRNELSIENDIIMWGLRVAIPSCYHHKILYELHKNHLGMSRMK